MLFFWFFKNCKLIRDSSLWHSNFIPLVHDSIIIIGSRSVTYTFGSHFAYKCWVRVFYQNLNFSFLGQVFLYFCWVSKHVYWGSHHLVSEPGSKISFLSILSFVSCYHPILFLLCSLFFVLILWRALGQNRAPSSKKKKKKKWKKKTPEKK